MKLENPIVVLNIIIIKQQERKNEIK